MLLLLLLLLPNLPRKEPHQPPLFALFILITKLLLHLGSENETACCFPPGRNDDEGDNDCPDSDEDDETGVEEDKASGAENGDTNVDDDDIGKG